jgi:DNA-directed RNA polymerase subunit RPC12/RpoP
MKQKCTNKHCGHEWDYKGQQKHYTNCPKCMYKVKIKRDEDVI